MHVGLVLQTNKLPKCNFYFRIEYFCKNIFGLHEMIYKCEYNAYYIYSRVDDIKETKTKLSICGLKVFFNQMWDQDW